MAGTQRASKSPEPKRPDRSFLAQLEQLLKQTERDGRWRTVVLYSNGVFRVELAIAPPNERVEGATVSLRICGQALRNCLTVRNPQLLDDLYRAVEYIKRLQQSDKGKEIIMWWLQHSYDVKKKKRSTERVMLEL